MAEFTKKNIKPKKDNGTYVFADFSYGLHNIDTPRAITEQLSSLALKGGRNVWSESGALIAQYGYTTKAVLPPNEYVIGMTETSKNGSDFFILTQVGNIYRFSANEGLKRYVTTIPTQISTDAIFTRINNHLVLINDGSAMIFGDNYDDSEYVPIVNNASCLDYKQYVEFTIPVAYLDNFWRNKKIYVNSIGAFNITDIRTGGLIDVVGAISKQQLLDNNPATLEGGITVNDKNFEIVLDEDSGFKIKAISEEAQTGQTVEVRKLRAQCYKYTITNYENQYGSFSKTGYIYVKASKASANARFYFNNSKTKATTLSELSLYRWTATMDFFGTVRYNPRVYSVSGNNATSGSINPQLYKDGSWGDEFTGIGGLGGNGVLTLTRDTSGDIYEVVQESTTVTETKRKVQFDIPRVSGGVSGVVTITTPFLTDGNYKWRLVNSSGQLTVSLYSGNTETFREDRSNFFDEGTTFDIVNDIPADTATLYGSDGQPVNIEKGGSFVVTAVPLDSSIALDIIPETNVSIGEKTLHPISLIYIPEDSQISPTTINPKLLGVGVNRLFVVDYDGTIYYSAVGILDNFNESAGAGFFRDFYNDASETLKIEDYQSGVLITKQNGLYYAKISNNVQSDGVDLYTSSGVNIARLASIGQEYATDHIVLLDKIYAYDSNTSSIVLAAYQSYYGNLTYGGTLIPSEQLNAIDLGITQSKRSLVYCGESNVFILYYGETLQRGIVLTSVGGLFPRELDIPMRQYILFNQGIAALAKDGTIFQDFKTGTLVPNISSVAEFEAIGLRDNRMICSTMLEVTELNGVRYDVSAANAGYSTQKIIPYSELQADGELLPDMIYSDYATGVIYDSFELTSKWANKTSNLTRIYAPMSGREGVSLTLEFPENTQFCLAALRLPDFSQGE